LSTVKHDGKLIQTHPWHNEDFEKTWGFLDCADKVIVDIGADYGSTPYFFLQKRAKRVIAIESFQLDYDALAAYAEQEPRVIAIFKHVSNAKDYKDLIICFQPDIMKIDCEGCEAYLLDLDDRWFAQVPEYAIELHNLANAKQCGNPHNWGNDLRPPFEEKFKRCGYENRVDYLGGTWVIWARKKPKCT